jgi:hypothetical protein
VGVARSSAAAAVDPERALEVWSDPEQWPAFVEGFARILEADPAWPAPGATVVWESIPQGRGRVAEKVVASGDGSFVTEVSEQALEGVQTVSARPGDEDGAVLELSLDYQLNEAGLLGPITDVIFIRRALSAALGRTLERFATEVIAQER